MRAFCLFCAALASIVISGSAHAQDPDETATVQDAAVASATLPPEPPTATIVPGATPFPTPGPATNASITFRMIEDKNGNRYRDGEDGPPGVETGRVGLFLTAWGRSEPGSMHVEMSDSGEITLARIPAGDYDWRMYWPSGFIDPPSSQALPHLLLGAFKVHPDGSVTAPEPLPDRWPSALGVEGPPFDPVRDRTVLGSPPREILLARKTEGVIAGVPGTDGAVFASAIGRIDVGAALFGQRPPIAAPDTGAGPSPSGPPWLLLMASAMMVGVAYALLRRRAA